MPRRKPILVVAASLAAVLLLCGFFPFRHKKYETPISKDTLQPDKILFDRAIRAIEHGNYEQARLLLNTMINTYDTSEFLAKAKLAIADSWYREGGAHGLAQAEAEYKDFILFYPNMEESAESQYKVCQIHYKQMEKADRDNSQAQRAEDECKQVMTQFPNSKFTKDAEQMLRNVQEVLADKEYRAGDFYFHKGSYPAAASRFNFVTQQYPLYSGSDEALWQMASAFRKMGDRFEGQESDALSKIVKEYPLSDHVDQAKERLTSLKRPVPQADPASYAHMKYELENRQRMGMVGRTMGVITGKPDTSFAARSGTPSMQAIKPSVPVSVPQVAAGAPAGAAGVSDVVAGVVNDSTTLDQSKDARLSAQQSGTGEQKASVGSNGQSVVATDAPPPTNHPATAQQIKAYQKQQQKAQQRALKQAKKAKTPAPAAPPVPAAAETPASATSGAASGTTATTPPGSSAPPQ